MDENTQPQNGSPGWLKPEASAEWESVVPRKGRARATGKPDPDEVPHQIARPVALDVDLPASWYCQLLAKDVRLSPEQQMPDSTRTTFHQGNYKTVPSLRYRNGSPTRIPPVLSNSNSVRESRLAVPKRLPLYSVLHPQARETTPPVSAQRHYLTLILLTSKESAGLGWAGLGSARLAPQQLQESRQVGRQASTGVHLCQAHEDCKSANHCRQLAAAAAAGGGAVIRAGEWEKSD